MAIDREMILKKLGDLEKYVKELQRHQRYTLEDLRKDLSKQWTVSHGLQLVIQIVLDIGNHILADRGINAQDYTDLIDKMGDYRIIPPEFARKIRGLAGFRNVIVHGYSSIDLVRLHSNLRGNLGDFSDFARYVLMFLEKEG